MKGSVKSQLNYADIHQSPVVKHFFHKILRLLSAVTNEGSHNPGGAGDEPFFTSREQDNTECLWSTFSAPEPLLGALILRTGSTNMHRGFRPPSMCPLPPHLLLLTNVVTTLIQIPTELAFRLS